ncbi:hypothetical protein PybrP1_003008 [[Pythium] brassicae (nom. inval.)]|nr:hypothetical protein PybrP1_003008 [[Pythium] brassicae (nom. inval.)]
MKLSRCWVLAALGVSAARAYMVDWESAETVYDVGTVHSYTDVRQTAQSGNDPKQSDITTPPPVVHTKAPTPKGTSGKAPSPTVTPSESSAATAAPTEKPIDESTPAPADNDDNTDDNNTDDNNTDDNNIDDNNTDDNNTDDNNTDDNNTDDSDTIDDVTQSTNSTASGRFLQPFGTDAPSETLFKRNANLGKLAPIANLPQSIVTEQRPIPTNKWWGNLIHTTEKDRLTVASPAWSNPYAVKLPVKEAPFGLQACYSYSYRRKAGVANDKIKFYLHEYHNDVTLSAQDGAVTFKADGKSIIGSGAYTGSLRVAVLPDDASADVYDAYASCTKYASLCLLADDPSVVGTDTSLKTTCLTKLETLIEPFLTNDWAAPLVYETTYRGIVTGQVFTANDVNVDFGNGVTGKKAVEDLGSLMLRVDARAIRTYFLMDSRNTVHPPEFARNHVTGIFFDNKDASATIAWLSLLYVNYATVNQKEALERLANVDMDDGLTRSWALYNAATRKTAAE